MIDLSLLPAPSVIEELDYETIVARMLADLQARDKTFDALVESDPAYKVLEVAAYRELLLRQRVNSAARAVMLAYATDTDLDQIGANFQVQRLLLDAGDITANPPVEPVYESDEDFRRRIQLSFEGYTCAGSVDSYRFWGLSASGEVADIQPVSPTPGVVTIYVLSRNATGTASPDLISAVEKALNAEKIRPLTDQVTVLSASIVDYAITAELVIMPGPDPSVVQAAAKSAATAYIAAQRKIGYDITLSGIYAALHQPGVQRVNLTTPTGNIVIGDGQAGHCTAINLTIASANDV